MQWMLYEPWWVPETECYPTVFQKRFLGVGLILRNTAPPVWGCDCQGQCHGPDKTRGELPSLAKLCCRNLGTSPASGMGDGLFQTPTSGVKSFEPSTKGFATITNQSIQSPSLWKMPDWLLSGWKGVAEIEIRSCNSVSICYCNSISFLSPLAPGLFQAEISCITYPHTYSWNQGRGLIL